MSPTTASVSDGAMVILVASEKMKRHKGIHLILPHFNWEVTRNISKKIKRPVTKSMINTQIHINFNLKFIDVDQKSQL